MAIPVWKFGICYFPAPKVANTSLKHALHEIRTGAPFQGEMDESLGRKRHIHDQYKTPSFRPEFLTKFANLTRFAVVRDPVGRLLSVYRNRVVFHKELSVETLGEDVFRKAGVPPSPDLTTFIAELARYRQISRSIDIHSAPLVDYLAEDPGFYSFIFRMEDSDQIEAFLYGASGVRLTLRRAQTGGPAIERDELTAEQTALVHKHYQRDYEVYGPYMEKGGGTPRQAIEPPVAVKPRRRWWG